jgi:hypothetical protein
MQSLLTLAVLCGLVLSAQAASNAVIELNPNNFKSQVLDSEDVWLVEFYGTIANIRI